MCKSRRGSSERFEGRRNFFAARSSGRWITISGRTSPGSLSPTPGACGTDAHAAKGRADRDRASELSFHGTAERDLIELFGEPIARSAIQRTGSLRGAIHVSDTTVPQIYEYASLRAAQTASRNNEQLRAHLQTNGLLPAEGAGINPPCSLAEEIARMQAIATQPDYFRKNSTPAQLATAASLVRQLSAIGFNITQLNSVVIQFRLRLEQAPFPQRQQIAAACIQACINEVNENTITSELNLRRPSVEGAGSSSGIRPQPLEGAHANAVFACWTSSRDPWTRRRPRFSRRWSDSRRSRRSW